MRCILAALCLLLSPALLVSQTAPTQPAYAVPADAKFTVTDLQINRIVGMTKEAPKEFKIGAALRTPTGEKPEGGWPAVLFVSGSGSQTKHGFQGPLDLGSWELLDAIANAGFMVLSSDDRGIGQTPIGEEGCDPLALGYDELVGDARACLTHLQEHAEVNRQRIFIIGHSEGGLTAPILAGDNEIAGVVFVAAMGRNLYDVTLSQTEDAARNAGATEAQVEQGMKLQRELQDAAKEERDPDFKILGDDAVTVVYVKSVWKQVKPVKTWWHDHFVLDVPAIHKAVKCPVLITQGKADFQVSVEKDARQIMKDVLEGECSDLTYKTYDDLDHLFKPCGGKKSEIKMYYQDRRMEPKFIKDVVTWLEDRK